MSNSLFNNPFMGMTTKKLLEYKEIYERIIAEQSPNYIPPIYPKTGKPIIPTKMPWMVKVWQRGLDFVNDALKERKEEQP